jgi:hypothetical protein
MEFDILKTEGTGGIPEELYTRKTALCEIIGKVILFDDKRFPLGAEVVQKIAGDLVKEFDSYLLDVKNCEEIKKLKYKTDMDFASLLFRIIAKQIIEKYASNFST